MKKIAVVVKTVTEFNRAASLLLAMGYKWVSDDDNCHTPHIYRKESGWGIGAGEWEVIYNDRTIDNYIIRGQVNPDNPDHPRGKLAGLDADGCEIWESADEFIAAYLRQDPSKPLQLNLKSID